MFFLLQEIMIVDICNFITTCQLLLLTSTRAQSQIFIIQLIWNDLMATYLKMCLKIWEAWKCFFGIIINN